MRAALSDSKSKVVGQNASDPILLLSRFTGAPTVGCQSAFLNNGFTESIRTFICPGPGLVESFLRDSLGLVPRKGWEHRSDSLHFG